MRTGRHDDVCNDDGICRNLITKGQTGRSRMTVCNYAHRSLELKIGNIFVVDRLNNRHERGGVFRKRLGEV